MFILLPRYCFRLFDLLFLRTEELEVSPLTNVILIEIALGIKTTIITFDTKNKRKKRKEKKRK